MPYEWDRLPSFLGFDVWHAGREQFLPPGTVENIYHRLNLHPSNTVAREVNVRDFDPEDYTFPTSEWYDGPVAGVVIENKRGGRARRDNPVTETVSGSSDLPESPAALVRHLATERRLSRVVSHLETRGRQVAFDTVYERLFESIVREEYRRLFAGSRAVDIELFRSELGDLVGAFLAR